MEDKTHEEIKTEVQRTTLLKNSVISVGKHSALTTYKPAHPGKNFSKWGHLANVCRSDNVNFLQNNNEIKPRNDNDDQPYETEDDDSVAFAEFTAQNGWEELQRDIFSMLAIADAVEIKETMEISEENLNGYNLKIKTKSARGLQQNDKSIIF